MRGGHNKVPTALALVRGNPGKRPLNDAEPQPPAMSSTNPPEWLDATAKRHWRRVLRVATWLTEADLDRLALYCQAYSRYRDLTRLCGTLDFDSKEFEGWEYADVAKVLGGLPIRLEKAEASLRALGSDLGLDPVSRTRIQVKKPDDGDAFDAWERERRA